MPETQEKIRQVLKDINKREPLNFFFEQQYLMSQTRQLIEQCENNKYELLKFYCNWSLHSRLDNERTTFWVLEKIIRIFAEFTKKDSSKIPLKISEIINLKKLKDEFVSIFEKHLLDRFLFLEKNYWEVFVGHLIYELLDKPILFPQKEKLKDINAKNKLDKLGYSIISLRVCRGPNNIERLKNEYDNAWWLIKIDKKNKEGKNIKITGKLF